MFSNWFKPSAEPKLRSLPVDEHGDPVWNDELERETSARMRLGTPDATDKLEFNLPSNELYRLAMAFCYNSIPTGKRWWAVRAIALMGQGPASNCHYLLTFGGDLPVAEEDAIGIHFRNRYSRGFLVKLPIDDVPDAVQAVADEAERGARALIADILNSDGDP